METENKTASQILTEAADLLEQEDNWGQGSYFKFEHKTEQSNSPACVMCAHGAIAYCGNPDVKNKVDIGTISATTTTAADARYAADRGASASAYAYWKDRARDLSLPDYIRKHFKGEVGLAHYQAAQTGLTFNFNDTPGRTKQEVIAKLREAAQL